MATAFTPFVTFSPPRPERTVDGQVYSSGEFPCKSMVITNAWGLQPGTATIEYVGSAPLVPGQSLRVVLGGHTFWGVCESNMPSLSTSGNESTCVFADNRRFLDWDVVYGEFNQADDRFVGNLRKRRWRHIYPVDHNSNLSTYSDAPLTAAQIIAAMLLSPTTESPWSIWHCHPTTGVKTAGYHPAMSIPAIGVDCYHGKKLGAAIAEVCEQLGLVLAVFGGEYDLVFARKGQGIFPSTPVLSNKRRVGTILSNAPTRVRVLGGRNLYQIHEITMEKDWAAGFEAFFGDPLKLRDYVFVNLSTHAAIGGVPAGTRYNAVTGDVEFAIGKQLAYARALEMTVSEWADARQLTHGDGATFRDYRLFAGKPRMLMPAALYVSNVLFRAFKLPSAFSFTNMHGATTTIDGIEIVPEMVARVTHNPLTGVMSWDKNKSSDGPGYAIIQGYMVGVDGFKDIRPEQFDLTKFTSAQSVWQSVPFQLDDSGEPNGRFIVFENPIINTSTLFTKGSGDAGTEGTEAYEMNGYAGLAATPTFGTPVVKAALCFRGERYSYIKGNGTRDEVVSFPNLYDECLISGTGLREVLALADGDFPDDKADEVAAEFLSRQFKYVDGGFERILQPDGSGVYASPTQLSGVVDRVTVTLNASGLVEQVDATAERKPRGFVNAREFDRQARDAGLYPGQRELREEANQFRLQAIALHSDPKTLKSLAEALHGPVVEVRITNPASGNIRMGTPVWRKAQVLSGANYTNVVGSARSDTTDHKVFAGATLEHNAQGGKPVKVQENGVALIRCKGPVNVHDIVGKPALATADYLVTSGSSDVGKALQQITGTGIRTIRVRIGTSGGGGATWV